MANEKSYPVAINRPPSMADLVLLGAEIGTMIETLRASIDSLAKGNKKAASDKLDTLTGQLDGFVTEIEAWVQGSEGNGRGS